MKRPPVSVWVLLAATTGIFCGYHAVVSSYSTNKGNPLDNTRRLSTEDTGEEEQAYELILEYAEGETMVDEECVEGVVKDKLPTKVFHYLEKNGVFDSNQADEFLNDWEVDMTTVEEIYVFTPPCSMENGDCETEAVNQYELMCEGVLCEDKTVQTFTETKKRRKKKRRKGKRFVVRSKARCTKMCFPDNNDKGRNLLSHMVGSTGDSLLAKHGDSNGIRSRAGFHVAPHSTKEQRRVKEEAQISIDLEVTCRRCRRHGCFIEITAENKKKCKNLDCVHKETCDGYQKPTSALPQAKTTGAVDVICRRCRRTGCFEEITVENKKKCRRWECQQKESCDGYKKFSSSPKKKKNALETKMPPPDKNSTKEGDGLAQNGDSDHMAPPSKKSQTGESEPQNADETNGTKAAPEDQGKTEIEDSWGLNTDCKELVNGMQFFFVPPIQAENGRQ